MNWNTVEIEPFGRGKHPPYAVWLEQGDPDDPTLFFIAEWEIDWFIEELQMAKSEIARRKTETARRKTETARRKTETATVKK